MNAALALPAAVSAAAHLPSSRTARRQCATTALRLEGFGPSVDARCRELLRALAPMGAGEAVAAEESARVLAGHAHTRCSASRGASAVENIGAARARLAGRRGAGVARRAHRVRLGGRPGVGGGSRDCAAAAGGGVAEALATAPGGRRRDTCHRPLSRRTRRAGARAAGAARVAPVRGAGRRGRRSGARAECISGSRRHSIRTAFSIPASIWRGNSRCRRNSPPRSLPIRRRRPPPGAIRGCVHCGFCTATCPTYVLLGNELDSPRGRIYLIKEMLENGALPSAPVVKHLDRCLSCLACETHCPSGVSYRRIIDKGRAYVQAHYRRPFADRAVRALLACILPHRTPLSGRPVVGGVGAAVRAAGSSAFPACGRSPSCCASDRAAKDSRRGVSTGRAPDPAPLRSAAAAAGSALRVGIAQGCVEPVLDPEIQRACARLLQRAGCEIVRAKREGCCGALSHHMGREAEALDLARANVDAWHRQIEAGPLAAIVVTASGCGPVIRDYGHLLRDDARYAAKAAQVSALACDLCELMERIGLPPTIGVPPTVVGYHAACSLQHGQRVAGAPAPTARRCGLRGARAQGVAPVLRFGGCLQYPAAGHRRAARRPQGAGARCARRRCDRDRQHRLHGANRRPRAVCPRCMSRSFSTGRPAGRSRPQCAVRPSIRAAISHGAGKSSCCRTCVAAPNDIR